MTNQTPQVKLTDETVRTIAGVDGRFFLIHSDGAIHRLNKHGLSARWVYQRRAEAFRKARQTDCAVFDKVENQIVFVSLGYAVQQISCVAPSCKTAAVNARLREEGSKYKVVRKPTYFYVVGPDTERFQTTSIMSSPRAISSQELYDAVVDLVNEQTARLAERNA